MSVNFIDFLPGEKSGRPLQYVTLLPEDLVLPPKPLQLGSHICLRRLTGCLHQTIPAAADPAHQRR
jgi:hypothetical protein